MRWWIVAALAVAGCAVGLLIGLELQSTSAGPSAAELSPAQAAAEKLRQEVRQLQISNEQDGSLQHTLLEWAPFITGLGAVAAVGATLWKQATDLESARTEMRLADEQWQERFLEDQRNSRMRERRLAAAFRREPVDGDHQSGIFLGNAPSECCRCAGNLPQTEACRLPHRSPGRGSSKLAIATQCSRRPGSWEQISTAIAHDSREPRGSGDISPTTWTSRGASLRRFDVSGVDFNGTVVDVAFADLSRHASPVLSYFVCADLM